MRSDPSTVAFSQHDYRELLRQRYAFRCGYCGISETNTGSLLTTDHFQPLSQGGTDAIDNLVYCCHTCNEYKGSYWRPTEDQRILHPLVDAIDNHIILLADGLLHGLTPTGAFHIKRLHLNRPPLVTHRREQIEQQRRSTEEATLLQRLSQLEQTVAQLETAVSHLRRF